MSIYFPSRRGKLLRRLRFLCVLSAQLSGAEPPDSLSLRKATEKALLSVLFDGNWILSIDAFYTVIREPFILKVVMSSAK